MESIPPPNPSQPPNVLSQTPTSEFQSAPRDPLQRYYCPMLCEFFAMLTYTLFSNLLGVIGFADSSSKLAIAFLDGSLNYAIICMFSAFSETHFNPAITLTNLLTMNIKALFGISIIFIQFFGAFFGALLTKATLSPAAFVDAFITHGIIKRNFAPSTSQNLFRTNIEQLENMENTLDNKFQIFLTETLLSTLIVTVYALSSTNKSVLTTASSVGAARSLAAMVGLFSLGQSANLARQLANNTICSIFLLDKTVWRYFYVSFFAAISSSVLAAGIWWLVTCATEKTQQAKRKD